MAPLLRLTVDALEGVLFELLDVAEDEDELPVEELPPDVLPRDVLPSGVLPPGVLPPVVIDPVTAVVV